MAKKKTFKSLPDIYRRDLPNKGLHKDYSVLKKGRRVVFTASDYFIDPTIMTLEKEHIEQIAREKNYVVYLQFNNIQGVHYLYFG